MIGDDDPYGDPYDVLGDPCDDDPCDVLDDPWSYPCGFHDDQCDDQCDDPCGFHDDSYGVHQYDRPYFRS